MILHADEEIVCPKCSHHFPLGEGVGRQAVERYAEEFENEFRQQSKELEEQLTKEAERKALRATAQQIAKLQDDLADSKRTTREAQEQIAKAREETRAKVIADVEQERLATAEDLKRKEEELQKFREQELTLRREKQALVERERNLELDLQRRLDEERKRITESISQQEAGRFQLLEAEYRKKIEDAQRANDDLRRKLEQGSQQLQGEVLELEIEHKLASAFVHDHIDEVKKGVRGADLIQTVRTPTGLVAGKIIWEAKRAENWSEKWITKLQDDQQEAKADIAVLVSTAMPKDVDQPFCRVGDIWLVAPLFVGPVAQALRTVLLETHKVRQANTGKGERIELLFNYLSSPAFAQRIRSVTESFRTMQSDLNAEKRAMQKLWAKRQAQIDRVTTSMSTVVGELQAIAEDTLPELETIDALSLEAPANFNEES